MRDDANRVVPQGGGGGTHVRIAGATQHAAVGFVMHEAAPGEQVEVLTRAALTSDSSEFYTYIEQIPGIIGARDVFINWDSTFQFLALLHEDGTGDLYLNDFPVMIQAQARRDIQAGEAVGEEDLGDIRSLQFPTITVAATDKIIYCFKCGWKFGLYFDLDRRKPMDAEQLWATLGGLYRYLRFQYVYKVLQGGPQFERMMRDGWFPFVELLGNRYRTLLRAYRKDPPDEADVEKVVAAFGEELCDRLTQRWQKHPVLAEKRVLLEAGMNAFLKGGAEGAIHSIKTLLPEIEGILRMLYLKETGRGDNVKVPELIAHIVEKGRAKAGSEHSLLLPAPFLEYLRDVFFANFNLEIGQVALSRHSASHGVARAEEYTRVRALQAILVLDQIACYL